MFAQQVAKESVAYKERKVDRKVSLESRDAGRLPLGENCIERCFAESEMYRRDTWRKGRRMDHHCDEKQRRENAQDSKQNDTRHVWAIVSS
jgi:hypothetical protein